MRPVVHCQGESGILRMFHDPSFDFFRRLGAQVMKLAFLVHEGPWVDHVPADEEEVMNNRPKRARNPRHGCRRGLDGFWPSDFPVPPELGFWEAARPSPLGPMPNDVRRHLQ